VAMSAGLKTLELLSAPGFFEDLEAKTERLANGLVEVAKRAGVPLTANCVGGMFGIFFTDVPQVTSYAQATACNVDQFKRFYHAMLARGVYLAPSAFEAGFVSAAHTDADLDSTLTAAAEAFAAVA
jgi:glutamate-1-semialdehyde 2,1-aminomutase